MTSDPAQQHHFSEIPLINIRGLYSQHPDDRLAVAREIAHASAHVGFFYITGHAIPESLTRNLISTAKTFFGQSEAVKMQSYIGLSQNHSGYVPEGEEVFYGGGKDRKEAYDINYDLRDLSLQRPMLGPNLWPDMADFQPSVSAYYQAGIELAKVLFRGFALALGLDEEFFDDRLRRPPNQLRLIHYPYDPDAEDREGIGAHTDYECFTLLLPTADGLEVLNGRGEWINAPVIPGSLVVNIGDMMEVLSNGRFVATTHRVRKVNEERYSFPLFCTCDYDTVIEPVVTSSGKRQYTPVQCGDHLYAQTIDTFTYLQKRLAAGQIERPESEVPERFGREAKADD